MDPSMIGLSDKMHHRSARHVTAGRGRKNVGNIVKQASAALDEARQGSTMTTGLRNSIKLLHRHHKQHQQVSSAGIHSLIDAFRSGPQNGIVLLARGRAALTTGRSDG